MSVSIGGLALLLTVIQTPDSSTTRTELSRANEAWLQCIASRRADYVGSLVKFGPKFQVNGSGQFCSNEIESVRSAIRAALPPGSSEKEVSKQFKANKAGLVREYEALLKTNSSALPNSCRASVSKGLQAYQVGDFETALCHWLPKARGGDPAAQNNMGLLFERGLTNQTPKSDEEAAKWYLLSARQGFVLAMRNLAQLQQRLGHNDVANSWLVMAAAAERQQAEGAEILSYQLGCMIAGGCASARSYSPTRATTGSNSSGLRTSQGPMLCPNGTYVGGSPCTRAPDGTYVYGQPTLAPDGTYVGGSPRLAPNGTYVGGAGQIIQCPDGNYVAGERCILTPSGTYVGE